LSGKGEKTKEKETSSSSSSSSYLIHTQYKVVQNFDSLFHYQFKALMRIKKNSIHAFDEKPLSRSSILLHLAAYCLLLQ
jgi:hypothetical protein